MPLPQQLIEQARHLASRGTGGRPRQDHLRRAASTAYYALFHFLIDQTCRSFLGTPSGAEARALHAVLARAFDHASMKRVCVAFGAASLPVRFRPGLGARPIPTDLSRVSDIFTTLQERRHSADYDRLRRFQRQEVLTLIDEAERAMQLWPSVRPTQAGRLFMLALLVGDRIRE